MALPWKRVYVDIPIATDEKLNTLAAERGMSKKKMVATLIEDATESQEQLKTRKRGRKK